MHTGRTVFSQLTDFLPLREFRRGVARYRGQHKVRRFSCLDQYLAMAFAQLTYRESLRDIETCLRVLGPKLYHAGFRSRVSRSTLAEANQKRDWRIFADFARVLIDDARALYATDDFLLDLDQTAYALDSTTIDLCLSLFPWAHFRKRKGAVKLHALLDLRGEIPVFAVVTHGRVHDGHFLDRLPLSPGAIYVMDRAYLDFRRLYTLHSAGAFFVTRARAGQDFRRTLSRAVDRTTGLRCDQTIRLAGLHTKKKYPDRLRRVGYRDPETGEATRLSDQPLRPAGVDDRRAVPRALADRTLLQVD